MRDLIAASAHSKRLREKMQEVGRALIRDEDPQPLIDEADAEVVKLAAAFGYVVMKLPEVGR